MPLYPFHFIPLMLNHPPRREAVLFPTTPTQVRGEGLTERFGAIVFQCTGFIPASTVSGNLTFFLPVSITNRVDSNNNAVLPDPALTLDTGSGPTPTGIAGKISGNNITFQGLNITVPASGGFNLKVANIRGAAYQTGFYAPQQISALIWAAVCLKPEQCRCGKRATGSFHHAEFGRHFLRRIAGSE